MKKAIIYSIFILITITFPDFAKGDENHSKHYNWEFFDQVKDKKATRKAKLRHYHGDNVKLTSNYNCCRIRKK
ncbi:MAG: hypothetical protein N2999_06665 [Proteobacteria bacterium]|nr:hypothetical protein [Pseudomonadota bacterium]